MGHVRNGRAARDGRRNDAAIRQAERDGRSDDKQLRKLCVAGHGHCKEALRLAARVHGKGGMEAWINDEDCWKEKEDV